MFNPFRLLFGPAQSDAKSARGGHLIRFIHIDGNVYSPSICSPTGVEFFTKDDSTIRPCLKGHIAPNGVTVLQIAIALAVANGIITIGGHSSQSCKIPGFTGPN